MRSSCIAFTLFVFTTILVSCTSAYLIREDYRAEYQLKNYGGLMVTNWADVNQNCRTLAKQGHVKIVYPFIAENIDKAPVTLAIQNAKVIALDTMLKANCKAAHLGAVKRSAGGLVLAPRQRVKVDCRFELNREQNPKFSKEDFFTEIQVPFRKHSSKKDGLISLSYKIKIEDFQ